MFVYIYLLFFGKLTVSDIFIFKCLLVSSILLIMNTLSHISNMLIRILLHFSDVVDPEMLLVSHRVQQAYEANNRLQLHVPGSVKESGRDLLYC